MKTFVASGKDIITAKDMKVAIDDGSGVVGCQVAYVTVDSTKQTLTSHKWTGVNAYTDIKYEENGIRVYRAHGIGTGSFLSHAEINKLTSSLQEDTKLVVHDDFSLPSKIEGKIKVQLNAEQDTVVPTEGLAVKQNIETIDNTTVVSIPDAQLFSCPETGCVKIYRTFSGLEAHMLFGKHALKLERISTYDEVRIQWAAICNEVCVTLKTPLCQGGNEVEASTCSTNMGWGLKKDKKTTRFKQHVKDYFIRIYHEGNLTGKKANPQDVAYQMRTLKNDDGNKLFKLTECLQTSQITSFFLKTCCKGSCFT